MNDTLRDIINELRHNDWLNELCKFGGVFLVGGIIRDSYMDKESKDVDLVVENLSLEDIKNILTPHGKVDIVGESFSVIKFKPKNSKEYVDIATPRKDRKIGNGHKGFEIITEGVSIKEDLKRRDFTINSMAIDMRSYEFIDLFGGGKDLHNKLIRATDKKAFVEDPLRILRGIQFSSRFNFKVEKETLTLMKEHSHLIKEVSGERILEEFNKIIDKHGNTNNALKLIQNTDIDLALFNRKMLPIFPDIDYLDNFSFFYILGALGGVNPYEFYKNILKGDTNTAKNIKALDDIINISCDKELDKRFKLFNILKTCPEVINAELIPENISLVIRKMLQEEIPLSFKDININGNDIMKLSDDIKGEDIGKILNLIAKEALMKKFNWKNKDKCIELAKKIIENFLY